MIAIIISLEFFNYFFFIDNFSFRRWEINDVQRVGASMIIITPEAAVAVAEVASEEAQQVVMFIKLPPTLSFAEKKNNFAFFHFCFP